MSDTVVVIGSGGHAKVVVATLVAQGLQPSGIFDDDSTLWGTELHGVEIKGAVRDALKAGKSGVLAVGSNHDRKRLAEELSLEWITVVHPSATVHHSVRLGPGTVVFAGSTIQPDTVVGDHAIINTGANIDHDCRIGSYAHVAPGVSLAGSVSIGNGALVGVGSSAIPGVKIGDWSVVGAGAAVVDDIEPKTTVVGVPAMPTAGDGES